MRHKLVQCSESEHFAVCGQQNLPHVFTTDPEPTAINARDDLKSLTALSHSPVTHLGEPNYPCDLITGRPIVTRNLRFDHRSGLMKFLRLELARSLV